MSSAKGRLFSPGLNELKELSMSVQGSVEAAVLLGGHAAYSCVTDISLSLEPRTQESQANGIASSHSGI